VEKSEYYFRRILQAGTGNLPNPWRDGDVCEGTCELMLLQHSSKNAYSGPEGTCVGNTRNRWNFRFTRRQVRRWQSSGMLHRAVRQKSVRPDGGDSKYLWNDGTRLHGVTAQAVRTSNISKYKHFEWWTEEMKRLQNEHSTNTKPIIC
jgi:hypothetical protein